jgi:uncharacterized OB-fold protein
MVNCPKCGAILKEGEKFCTACGAKIEPHETPTSQAMSAYSPQSAKKNNKGLVIGIIAIIAIVIAALILVVILLGGGSGGDSRLVGTWEYDIMGQSVQYIFNADGTLKVGSMGYSQEVGTWRTNGNQLCMEVSTGGIDDMDSPGEQCVTYSISSDGNTLTLTQSGMDMMFTKV